MKAAGDDRGTNMGRQHHQSLLRLTLLTAALTLLAACNAFDRVSDIGDAPKLSAIDDPTHAPGYTPVRMPMPPPSAPAPFSATSAPGASAISLPSSSPSTTRRRSPTKPSARATTPTRWA
jgi:hypothetical protein